MRLPGTLSKRTHDRYEVLLLLMRAVPIEPSGLYWQKPRLHELSGLNSQKPRLHAALDIALLNLHGKRIR